MIAIRLTVWVIDVQDSAILVESCTETNHLVPACLTIDVSSAVYDTLSHHSLFIQTTTKTQADLNTPNAYIDKTLFDELIQQHTPTISSGTQTKASFIPSDTNGYLPYRTLVGYVQEDVANRLSHALQLLRWRLNTRYCCHCGTQLSFTPFCRTTVCRTCNTHSYPSISPCIITAVTRSCPLTGQPELLLAQHHRHKDGMYGLIAGYVEIGESLEGAVAREVFEETGLSVGNIRYSQSQPWPYPSNLMIGFMACHTAGTIMIDECELTKAAFFKLNALPKIPNQGTIARSLIEQVGKDHQTAIICHHTVSPVHRLS